MLERVSPRMRSWTTVSPSSGTRRRTAPSPSSSPRKPRLPLAVLEGLDVVRPARRAVGLPAVEQLLEDLARGGCGAAVWKIGPSSQSSSEPAQRLEDLLDVLGRRALAVGVLDAQHELARPCRAPGASCTAPCARRRCAARRSGEGAKRHASERMVSAPHAPMLIGAHVSPAGGPAKAVERGDERGCRSIQIFNQNPRPGSRRVYTDEEVAAYHEAMAGSAVEALLIHAVYLLNCASEDPEIRDKSLASLIALAARRRRARRARRRPAPRLGRRPATRRGDRARRRGDQRGAGGVRDAARCTSRTPPARAARWGARSRSWRRCSRPPAATSGSASAWTPATCCASGYDVRTAEALGEVLDEFDQVVGFERLGSLHLNDSMTAARLQPRPPREPRRGRDRRRGLRRVPVRAALRGPAVRSRGPGPTGKEQSSRSTWRGRPTCGRAGSRRDGRSAR